ncbi:MAG: ester cyclase [Alphaproteobacteria bacterium]|nr:ester cyclase [Alphaproteobacteria bacterium]
MDGSPNKATVLAYFEQFWNQGDHEAASEIFASDIAFHYPLGELAGVDAVKAYAAAVRTAFPDIHFTAADLVQEQDQVAARWFLQGTQSGAFRDKAPTNRQVSVSGITIFKLENNRIAEMWVAFDPARLTGD